MSRHCWLRGKRHDKSGPRWWAGGCHHWTKCVACGKHVPIGTRCGGPK